jgi:hypothetical protein
MESESTMEGWPIRWEIPRSKCRNRCKKLGGGSLKRIKLRDIKLRSK